MQIWTILVALLAGAVGWFAISLDFGLGIFVTALWSVAGLRVLEGLLRAALVPPGQSRNLFAVLIWGAAKLAIYGLAVWVLLSRPFPALSHAVGFTILMVLLVGFGAKARSTDINGSTRRGDDA